MAFSFAPFTVVSTTARVPILKDQVNFLAVICVSIQSAETTRDKQRFAGDPF